MGDRVRGARRPRVLGAEGVDEAEWIANTRLARAEAHWLEGDDAAARADLARIREVITPVEYHEDAQLAIWEVRLTGRPATVSPPPEPWATWLAGDNRGAATRWDDLGCRYHAALALHDSDSTTTCARRSPASRHSAPTRQHAVPAGG